MSVPWFAEQEGDFLAFRVNRRPLAEPDLFTVPMPEDVFEHFVRVLHPGREVVTGRRNQRTWRIGGIVVDAAGRTVFGKIGWVPRGEEQYTEWDDKTLDWISLTASPRGGRIVPFAFDGDTRLLAVLAAPRTPPATTAYVFETVLRKEEAELPEHSTEWSVEPILDADDFRTWLRSVDVLDLVSFSAKLPNPEPSDAFRDLYERMEARRATQYRETMRSSRETGLTGIEDDPDFKQAIAMGEQGFATLRGVGHREGAIVRYIQTDTVAKEHVYDLPDDWSEIRRLTIDMVKRRLRRFLDA